jgi:transcriptional regulator GlxA family with amidase domain
MPHAVRIAQRYEQDRARNEPGDNGICPLHVRRAIIYLRQHIAEKVTLADLLATAGTSERSLRRNFTQFLGLSPLVYLQRLRLTAIRAELSRSEDTISCVAARFGLTHVGRFSVAYRARFGESPSDTRRRREHAFEGLAIEHYRGETRKPCPAVAASSASGASGQDCGPRA